MSNKPIKATIAVFALIIVLVFNLISVQAALSNDTEENILAVKSAEVISCSNVSGENLVYIADDQTVNAVLGTFEMPGAYVEIKISVVNNGSETAYLTGVETLMPEIADIRMDVPQFNTEREQLKPKEQCDFTVVISWDESSTRCFLDECSGDFGLRLVYTCDDSVETTSVINSAATAGDSNSNTDTSEKENSDIPDTGDTERLDLNLGVIGISLIGIILIVCTHKKTGSEN